ncbi:MAG: DUF4129 domain-containing protein [Nonlabens sp.]|uniref:DUF4129 domain-containing protein n=1 Tax=Nonlabens sp. TaxID=1888209 RepID=UPI003EF6FFEB
MRKLIILLVVLGSAFAKAQSIQDLIPKIEERPREITDTLNRDYDDRSLTVPDLGEDLRETYTGNDYYYYQVNDDGENFFTRFLNGIFNWIGDVFGIEVSPFWAQVLKILVFILMAAVGIYFLVRLLSNESPQALLSRNSRMAASVNMEETHIEQIDLGQLIKDSIATGNYRNAVRYLYLDSLKWLSTNDKIDWDFQKTNSDYYRELKEPGLKEHFKKISYLYDYVWYGEFELQENSFQDARNQFESLKNHAS